MFASAAHAASIEGFVRDAITRRPIPNASIGVAGSDVHATSDDEGAFVLSFEDTRLSGATLNVEAPGFSATSKHVAVAGTGTAFADVALLPAKQNAPAIERRSRDNLARGASFLDGATIAAMPGFGFGDVALALRTLPGVAPVDAPPASGGAGVFIRGTRPQESAVLLDDIEVPALEHATGTAVIPATFLDGALLVPGAFSARYGRSLGGVVVLQSKEVPSDVDGAVHASAQLSTVDASATASAAIGDETASSALNGLGGGGVVVGARKSVIDLLAPVVGLHDFYGGVTSVPSSYDYQAKLEWRPSKSGAQSLDVVAFGSGDDVDDIAFGATATHQFSFHRVGLAYRAELGGGFTNTLTPVLGYQNAHEEVGDGISFFNADSYDVAVRDELAYRSAATKVIAGVDATARFDAFTFGGLVANNGVRDFPSADPHFVIADDRVRDDAWRTTSALYLEGTLTPLDNVVLTPGLRAEAYLLNGESHFSLEPRFAGSVTLNNDVDDDFATRFDIGAGSFSRPPDQDELAIAVAEGTTLPPQQALQIQGGVEQSLFGVGALSSHVFSTWRSQLTTRSPAFPLPLRFGDRAVYDGASAQTFGLETFLRFGGAANAPVAWLAYTIARTDSIDAPSSPYSVPYAYRAPFDVTHALAIVAMTPLPWGFHIGARFHGSCGVPLDVVAGTSFDADAGSTNLIAGPKSSGQLGFVHALDVRADWRTKIADTFALAIGLDVDGIDSGLPFPTLGVRASF
jgi:hypothetical protein